MKIITEPSETILDVDTVPSLTNMVQTSTDLWKSGEGIWFDPT